MTDIVPCKKCGGPLYIGPVSQPDMDKVFCLRCRSLWQIENGCIVAATDQQIADFKKHMPRWMQ